MRTGQNGRIAILWTQTEIDGLEAAPLSFLSVGAAWSWRGQARFLAETFELNQQRSGVAQGSAGTMQSRVEGIPTLSDQADGLVVLTNGARQFTAALFSGGDNSAPILVFEGDYPDRDQEFWISEVVEIERQSGEASPANSTVVAFPAQSRSVDASVALTESYAAKTARRAE